MLAFTSLPTGLVRRKDSQTACTMWTAVLSGRSRAGTKETEAKSGRDVTGDEFEGVEIRLGNMGNEGESEDALKLRRENERGRLYSSDDALRDEQKGRIYIHALYSLSKSEIIRNENGNVTVKSEGRNRARVVLHRTPRGSERKKGLRQMKSSNIKNGAYNCRMTAACTIQCCPSGRIGEK